MTEPEFKAYIGQELWRQHDSTFADLLDSYISKTNRAIVRDVKVPNNNNQQTVIIDALGYGTLPPDRRAIQAVRTGDNYRGMLSFYEPSVMISSQMPLDGYSIVDGKLYIGGPPLIHGNPPEVVVVYSGPLEPFFDYVTGDNRGFYTRHPDFYEAKFGEIVAISMRDAYMQQACKATYRDLLEDVRSYEMNLFYGDGPLNAPLPGVVA